jgi:hypothetical protein
MKHFLLGFIFLFLTIQGALATQEQAYPYQCQIFNIPANQIPYTQCTYQVYLQSYIGPRPGPTFFWNNQVAYGINHEFLACNWARNYAGQQCQQAAWQWYGGRAACYDQFYRCTSYIPVPRQ